MTERAVLIFAVVIFAVSGPAGSRGLVRLNEENYKKAIDRFRSDSQAYLAVVSGSWCKRSNHPDFNGKINQLIAAADEQGLDILRIDVGNKREYTKWSHFLKRDRLFKLTSIPSLFLVVQGKVLAKLESHDIKLSKRFAAMSEAVSAVVLEQ
jgi:hypothetical protein